MSLLTFSYADALQKNNRIQLPILETKTDPNKSFTCPICYDIPFLPTSMNIYLTESENSIVKCNATVYNPCCLTCIRDFIDSQKDEILVKCPYNCCTSFKHKKTYLNYGKLPRSPTEEAEYELWYQQFKHGTINRKCTLCEHVCSTFVETINHSRNDCLKRKITCKECKEVMTFEDSCNHYGRCIEVRRSLLSLLF